jgi:ATP-binding cassette, subfamily B, bacterial CvaB/MchF/RaxB
MLKLHVERFADIVFSSKENYQKIDQIVDTKVISNFTIKLVNVSFRYSEHEPDILKNINLTIPMGQCIAIKGVSGCGKTTLLKLILRLLEPYERQSFIGNTLLSDLDINSIENYLELLCKMISYLQVQ